MKSKLAQLITFVNQIDRRYLQAAYLTLVLAGMFIMQAPSDGGIGPSR